MYPITVLKIREDGTTELATIELTDILYISVDGAKLVFHTSDAQYYQMTTMQEFEDHLESHNFVKLDRPYLVNMNKIKSFNEEHRLVYFDQLPSRNSKNVTVARVKVNLVNSFIRKQ